MERPIRRLIQTGLVVGSLAFMGCEASSYGPRLAKDGCVEGASWSAGPQGRPISYRICKERAIDHAILITRANNSHPGVSSVNLGLAYLGRAGCREIVEAREDKMESGWYRARYSNREECWNNLLNSL